MRRCANCGRELLELANYCDHCGAVRLPRPWEISESEDIRTEEKSMEKQTVEKPTEEKPPEPRQVQVEPPSPTVLPASQRRPARLPRYLLNRTSKRRSVAVLCLLVLILIVSSVILGFVALPNTPLSPNISSDLDENRLRQVESLVDWANTNTRIVRMNELGTTSSVNGSRPFVVRFDDVRDTAYRSGITAFLELALQKKIKVTLGIVAGDFGTEPLLSLVRRGVQEGYFEVAIHGWLHEDFAALNETQITELIRNAKNRLQELLPGAEISTLIPPFEEVNAETLSAAAANDLRYVTSDLAHGEPYESNGVRFLPKTVDTGMPGARPDDQWTMYDQAAITQEVEKSFKTYGYTIAVLHPQQLTRHWTANVFSLVLIGAAVAGVTVVVSFALATRLPRSRKREQESPQSTGRDNRNTCSVLAYPGILG